MGDININVRGEFAHDQINEIFRKIKANPFSSADKINIYLSGRRAKISNNFLQILGRRIAHSGFQFSEGPIGTLQSSFSMTTVAGGAINTTGITYDKSNKSLWVCDNNTNIVYNISPTGGAPLSQFPLPTAAEGISIDPGGDLWIVSTIGSTVFKISQAGATLQTIQLFGPQFSPVLTDITYSWIDDTIWVANFADKKLYQFGTNGNLIRTIDNPKLPTGAPAGITGLSKTGTKFVATSADTVYIMSDSGAVIKQYPSSVFSAIANDLLGITFSEDGTHRIVDHATLAVYTVAGTPVDDILSNGTIQLFLDYDNVHQRR